MTCAKCPTPTAYRYCIKCANQLVKRLAEALDTRREACRQGWRNPRPPRPIKIVLTQDAGEQALAIITEERQRYGDRRGYGDRHGWKKAAAVRLRPLGLPIAKIAAMVGLHHSTVMYHLGRLRKGKR